MIKISEAIKEIQDLHQQYVEEGWETEEDNPIHYCGDEQFFQEAVQDLASYFIVNYNNGQLVAHYDEWLKLDPLGFVMIGEWIVHPDHWREATDQELRDHWEVDLDSGLLPPVVVGLDTAITAKTMAAVNCGIRNGMWSLQDLNLKGIK